MSLYDKKWDGICPVPECNCFHQDENDWLSTRDVKEAIKELIDFCNIHKGTLIVADALKKIMIKEFGKELCSGVEE